MNTSSANSDTSRTTAIGRLVHAELRKLTTTTWFRVTMAATIALPPVAAVANVFSAGRNGQAPLGTAAAAHHILSSAAVTSMAMLAVGIATTAGEYRHRTSIPTFLVTPHRRDVLVAKLMAVGGVGTVAGAVGFCLALAAALPAMAARGVHHLPSDTLPMLIGAALASALYGALGVALGALTRSTVLAIVSALVWAMFVEVAFIDNVWPSFGRWLPTGANTAITHTAERPEQMLGGGLAAVVLVAWTVALTAAAVRFAIDREV